MSGTNILSGVTGPIMTCFYPLSGQYATLPRILYYVSLIFTIFGHNWLWLVAGAASSAMVFSSTAAVHSVILVTTPRKPNIPYDVDAIGTYVITSIGLIMVVPILTFSRTMRKDSVRHLIRLWGVVMLVGTACSIASFIRVWPEEEVCTSQTTGQNLTSPVQLSSADFTCIYSCFTTHNIIRNRNDIVAVPLGGINSDQMLNLVSTAGAISLLCFSNLIYFIRHQPGPGQSPITPRGNRAGICWLVSALISPLMFITAIGSAEVFFGLSGVPSSETPNLVGQWSVMLGAGLIIIGVSVDKWFDRKEKANPPNLELLQHRV
jgi:hypothetical protein